MRTANSRFILGSALIIIALSTIFTPQARAEVRLPKIFGDNMVLQQAQPVTVWGWADAGEKISIEFAGQKKEATADAQGNWKLKLDPMQASAEPRSLTISGSLGNRKSEIKDILVGEVWLCSGQSNMEMGMNMIRDAKKEIETGNYPAIRLMMVPNRWTSGAQTDMDGQWKACTPASLAGGGWGGFSACGYFFGRELHKTLNVPVGLIDATWGGTRIESWTPPEGFEAVPALKNISEQIQKGNPRNPAYQQSMEQTLKQTEAWLATAKTALTSHTAVPPMPTISAEFHGPNDLQHPTALYNGMIHPICPFALRGAIWYQGESNNGEGMLYAEKMKALVGGWRHIWAVPDSELAFYFVQIAPYRYGTKPEVEAELWEAQATAGQVITNSGMVVISDIGNINDIHPANKQEVGRRLALWALARTYGKSSLVYSGPTFKALAQEGDKLRLSFDHVGGGLASRDGKPLDWFEIIDADEGGFVKADAKIDGATILLSAANVKKPVAMRFAWNMLAEPNLMNAEGLPAGAFRAGTLPIRDWMSKNVPEAKDYKLVYDLDLAKLGGTIKWDVDNHASIDKPFDRIAYCLELQSGEGEMQGVYVSMDAFTLDLSKIGIPTVQSGAHFQQNVTNMNIFSNVKTIITGTGLTGGNLEFWPDNYGPNNSANVPNASAQIYDFGDQPSEPKDGYGSMQIHNHDVKQTLLAINHWVAGTGADIGIGNSPSDKHDWTFAANANTYSIKRLRILVHCK